MTPLVIDSFDRVGKPPDTANYMVRSSLCGGQASIHSAKISTKLVLSGTEIYTTPESRFCLAPSQFLLAMPGEYQLTVESPATGCCFYFDFNYVSRLMSELISEDLEGGDGNIPSIKTLRLPIQGSQLGLFMRAIANKQLEPDVDILATYLAQSAIDISCLSDKLPCQRKSTQQELVSRLEIARAYLMDAGNSQVTLQDLERASCLSRFHLVRSFACVYGAPPLRFHQNLKLDAAQKQIKAGVPKKVIAEQLGFLSATSFSRAYRRRHSCSPSEDQNK
jgi:AraC family transcriptional regulator